MNALPRLDHVMIAIPEHGEASARSFYVDLLGLKEIEKPSSLQGRGGLWLQTGSLQLHLGIDRHFIPAIKAHIAIEVENLEKMRIALNQANFTTTSDNDLPGFARFYVDDPFGNRIEILAPFV